MRNMSMEAKDAKVPQVRVSESIEGAVWTGGEDSMSMRIIKSYPYGFQETSYILCV